MRITRATDMGLRALMVLEREVGRRTTLADLAARLELPERHLGKVVQRLAKSGWVATSRGAGGGIEITHAGREAFASQVLHAFEGNRPLVDCDDPPCPLRDDCRLQRALAAAHQAFVEALSEDPVRELGRP